MPRHRNRDEILEMARSYQSACVLAAAADLNLFGHLACRGMTARQAADELACSERGITILLDALTSLELLRKDGASYSVPEDVAAALGREGPGSVLAMVQHQSNCLRCWSQLAMVVKGGRPADRTSSIRGEDADKRAFIGAMHDVSAPVADRVVEALKPLTFRRLLDVGGGPGTWTAALLRACPGSSAVILDLPEVIPMATSRIASFGLSDRVDFVAGDYLTDPLPERIDFAWVSAIVHQNSREENRSLFASVWQALSPGGRIVIRDVLMEPSRTSPRYGALFAVNMLVATRGGNAYTLEEVSEDLEAGGFAEIACVRRDDGMNSLVTGAKRT